MKRSIWLVNLILRQFAICIIILSTVNIRYECHWSFNLEILACLAIGDIAGYLVVRLIKTDSEMVGNLVYALSCYFVIMVAAYFNEWFSFNFWGIIVANAVFIIGCVLIILINEFSFNCEVEEINKYINEQNF